MTKKFTLFGMMLLLSVVSVFASGFELPKVDVARQQKMAAEVNTDLMMRPRGSVNSPFAKTPSLKMQKKQTSAFDMMREAEAPASNIYGLQVYNTDDIYDSWWKLDVATAKSTVQWSNEYLGAYNYNAGFVRKGIVYAITIETGYILKYDLATGEYLGYISLYSSDYSKYILHAAYDEKNDIVYVYTYNADGDGLMFQTYDPDTNTFSHIKTEVGAGTLAADPIIAMGYNPLDGFVYAVTLYEEKWIRIDTENGEYEDLNTIAFSPAYYTQAMVYSPNDFGFVYVGIDINEETYVMVVDPDTGAIKSKTLNIKEDEYAFMYCADQAVVNNASTNSLSGKTVSTYSGASERVSVEMTNEQAITAFQCDIYLPDGISIATIDGEYDINLSSRAKSSHSLSCVEQSDGSIRLLCYSMSLATFSGNEGELFDINFNISKEIEGNYQVLIDNIVLTDKAQNEYKSSTTIDFNVKAYVPADVNNDGSINVTDVVATASYILGLDTKKFIFEAADMNKDGVINVTDIVGIASIILNGGSASNVSAQRCAPNSSDVIKIEDFAAGKNQSQQVAIEMTNASDYSACQMDIRLPKGMSIAECELASAATDHMVAYRELSDGAVRVLVYSLTCQTLPNSEEGIISLCTMTDNRFEGGEIVVENILFADRGQNEYRLYDSVANVNLATGVSATDVDCVVYAENRSIVIISPCDQQATISSVDGLSRTYTLNDGHNEIATPQSGVYIVTFADRTFKVMVK